MPAISAATGALLAVALHPAFPVLGGITAAMAGAAAGMLLLRRHSAPPVSAVAADPRDGRIHDLEVALASERTMHEATKSQAALRQAEMERFLADMEMTRSMLEGQASQSVELAEELAEQKQRSDYLANHDLLTGLPNRRAFQDELRLRVDYASSSRSTVALLFVDLDRFKDVNDTLGHEAGDGLLQKVAAIFGATMRHDDFVARIGGDEFAMILDVPPDQARQITSNVAERVRLELQISVPSPDGDIEVGATIGIALWPQDATDAEGLLHAADQVMYVGKRRGRNRVVTTEELTEE
ncbi:MAG TPA: GGDEF domain-containing protein [Dongiaceae bacterium]